MSPTATPMAASVARFVARLVIGLPSTSSRSARKAPTATRYHPIRRFRRRAGSKGSVVAIASSLSQPLEAHPGGYAGSYRGRKREEGVGGPPARRGAARHRPELDGQVLLDRRLGRAHRLGLVLDRQQPETAVLACGCFFRDAPRIGPAWGNALPMLAATLGLQCANTSDRNTVAPCHATSAPRLRSRKVSPTDSISAKSRHTRLEAFNACAIWTWTCCAWTAVSIRGP